MITEPTQQLIGQAHAATDIAHEGGMDGAAERYAQAAAAHLAAAAACRTEKDEESEAKAMGHEALASQMKHRAALHRTCGPAAVAARLERSGV